MKNRILCTAVLLLAPSLMSVTLVDAKESASEAEHQIPDKRIVDCLLQGQIHKLGSTIYQAPPRPVKLPAIDCEIRGGDFLVFDRASFSSSLAHWLGLAKGGDVNAQIYVGEIFERGLGREPDYAKAAAWYERAADEGHPVAQINLAQLYEKGLGVNQDPDEAERLYARAFGPGIDDSVGLDSGSLDDPAEKIRRLEQSLVDARSESRDLSEQLQLAQLTLSLAENNLKQQEIEEHQLSEQLKLAQSRVDSLSGAGPELQTAEKELQRNNEELAATQFTISQLRGEVERNERQLTAYQSELDRITELEVELQQQAQEYDDVNQELKRTRLALTASNNLLEKQQQAFEEERNSLQKARDDLRAESSSSSTSNQELEGKIRVRETKLVQQATTMDGLRGEIDEQRNQSRTLQNRLTELRQQNDELMQAQAEADRYRAESQRLQVALKETQRSLVSSRRRRLAMAN